MADRLGTIFGTEQVAMLQHLARRPCSHLFAFQDRVNCPFFHKVGACRHGDRCNRLHHKPLYSQTVLIPHMWTAPQVLRAYPPRPLVSLLLQFYEACVG